MSDFNLIEDETSISSDVEWKGLDILPPNIQISSDGRIRKFITSTESVELKPAVSNDYLVVSIEGKTYGVHRLVATAFVPNPDKFTTVRHKNDDRKDNRAENLVWGKQSDNFAAKGKTNSRNKIYCKELDEVYSSLRSASFALGLNAELISQAIKEKCKIFGLSFKLIEASNSIVKQHDIISIDFDLAFEAAKNCKEDYTFSSMLYRRIVSSTQ